MSSLRAKLITDSPRRAVPGDADAIARLFLDSYARGKDSTEQRLYPFPQFLDPVWLRDAVTDSSLCWLVAEIEGEVVGTVGALVNIGAPTDRIAECFGLVVKQTMRHRGLASRLFAALTEELASRASYMIAETRTAILGGWRVVRHHGFLPIGYEPFAHATPAGSEAMLLTARIDEQALRARRQPPLSSADGHHALAAEVLFGFGFPSLPSLSLEGVPPAYPTTPDLKAPLGTEPAIDRDWCLRVEEVTEGAHIEPPPQLANTASGVARLHRLEGRDPGGRRYRRFLLSGEIAGEMVAWARLVWDSLDRRARLLHMATSLPRVQGLMISASMDMLRPMNEGGFTLAIDVRTDDPALLATLETLGFIPTAYYPAFVTTDRGRVDCVQYTALGGQKLADGVPSTTRRSGKPGDVVAAAMRLVSDTRTQGR